MLSITGSASSPSSPDTSTTSSAATLLHPNFRLWLTGEQHQRFPSVLLQTCLKVTIEAPPGMKNNLSMTYDLWTPAFLQKGTVMRAQVLFVLAWFHAVVQERRKFIPQGWSKFYEFSLADLRSGADLIDELFLPPSNALMWRLPLQGMLSMAIYGGRIDNAHDLLILQHYLSLYFNDDVFTVAGRNPIKKIYRNIGSKRVHVQAN